MRTHQFVGYVLAETDPLGQHWVYPGTETEDYATAYESRRQLHLQGHTGIRVMAVTLTRELP
jgi:hypothetical protein